METKIIWRIDFNNTGAKKPGETKPPLASSPPSLYDALKLEATLSIFRLQPRPVKLQMDVLGAILERDVTPQRVLSFLRTPECADVMLMDAIDQAPKLGRPVREYRDDPIDKYVFTDSAHALVDHLLTEGHVLKLTSGIYNRPQDRDRLLESLERQHMLNAFGGEQGIELRDTRFTSTTAYKDALTEAGDIAGGNIVGATMPLFEFNQGTSLKELARMLPHPGKLVYQSAVLYDDDPLTNFVGRRRGRITARSSGSVQFPDLGNTVENPPQEAANFRTLHSVIAPRLKGKIINVYAPPYNGNVIAMAKAVNAEIQDRNSSPLLATL